MEKRRATDSYLEVEDLIRLLTEDDIRKPDVPVIIILDCCRSGILSTTSGSIVQQKKGGPSNVFILYATAEGHTASDGARGGNGAFTELFLKHMDMDGNIEDISKAILNELLNNSREAQVWTVPEPDGATC